MKTKKLVTMVSIAISSSSVLLVTIISFLIVLPAPIRGQVQAPPTFSACGPLFLPLAACAPFVQGTAQAPGQLCCDNLNRLYGQQPGCLCLVLGDTPISNVFPINRTLALALPSLCSLRFSTSTCSGRPNAVAKSPSSQVSLGTNDNSTSVATSPSPTDQLPGGHHTAVGLGLASSDCMKATRSNTHVLLITLLWATLCVFTFTGQCSI